MVGAESESHGRVAEFGAAFFTTWQFPAAGSTRIGFYS